MSAVYAFCICTFGVLQYVAACGSVVQCITLCFAVCCSVLQCVAVYYFW